MVSFKYKGRIHKGKFTWRSVRYALTDQLVRRVPALARRWIFPTEAVPIAAAAEGNTALPSVVVEAPLPEELILLRVGHTPPLKLTHHVYRLADVVVTGWAGAMIKDGLLVTVRPSHNWVSDLRAEPYTLRNLPSEYAYFNLMAPIPAKGHIFHWLYDGVIPLLSWLEATGNAEPLGVLLNAHQREIQARTLDFFKESYQIARTETLARREAALVPRLYASIPVPYNPRALQAPEGLAKLDALAAFIAKGAPEDGLPRRIYVSRNDARLRRVLNEDELLPHLEVAGFTRVALAGLPIAEQVQLFRRAEAVVAPHGAGLAHITWCRPGTKVIEFFPDPSGPRGRARNASADYWLISHLRQLCYRCHFGGPRLDRRDGFRIEPAMLKAALREINLC